MTEHDSMVAEIDRLQARVRALEEEGDSWREQLGRWKMAHHYGPDPDELIALHADKARWDDLIAGRFEIECMGTTTRYFNVVTPTGRFFTTADGSDLRPHLDAARQEPTNEPETVILDPTGGKVIDLMEALKASLSKEPTNG